MLIRFFDNFHRNAFVNKLRGMNIHPVLVNWIVVFSLVTIDVSIWKDVHLVGSE